MAGWNQLQVTPCPGCGVQVISLHTDAPPLGYMSLPPRCQRFPACRHDQHSMDGSTVPNVASAPFLLPPSRASSAPTHTGTSVRQFWPPTGTGGGAGGMPPRGSSCGAGHPAMVPVHPMPPVSPQDEHHFDLIESLLVESSSPSAFDTAPGLGHGHPANCNVNLAPGSVPQAATASALSQHAAAAAAMYGTVISPAGVHGDPGSAVGPNPDAFARMMSMDPQDDDGRRGTMATWPTSLPTRAPRSTTYAWPMETLTRGPSAINTFPAAQVRDDPGALGVQGVPAAREAEGYLDLGSARTLSTMSLEPSDDDAVAAAAADRQPYHWQDPSGAAAPSVRADPGAEAVAIAQGVASVYHPAVNIVKADVKVESHPAELTHDANTPWPHPRSLTANEQNEGHPFVVEDGQLHRSAKLEEVQATPDGIRSQLRDTRAKTEPNEEAPATMAAKW